MASTYGFNINGVIVAFTNGTGNTDGITITPDEVIKHSDQEIIGAIRTATKYYDEIRNYSFVREYYLSGTIDLIQLSNAPDGYVEEAIKKCEDALNITFFDLDDWESNGIKELIYNMRLILQGHSFIRQRKAPTRTPKKGYIYLIRAIEPNSHYKIGLSKKPVERIESLDVKLPYPIEVIHLIKTNDMYRFEKSLHDKYADKRVNGEWFALTDSDVQEICAMKGDE